MTAVHKLCSTKLNCDKIHNLRCVLGTRQGVFGEHMKRCDLIHSSMCVVLKTKKGVLQ